jgi:hypothetical protein
LKCFEAFFNLLSPFPGEAGSFQDRHKLFHPDGLAQIIIHSRFKTPLFIAIHGKGGHRDDAGVLAAGVQGPY